VFHTLKNFYIHYTSYLKSTSAYPLVFINQFSGAKVIVHEPRLGTSDRIIVISGTPDETQAAQSLLHAFILTGQY
jgi:hypothetical protein